MNMKTMSGKAMARRRLGWLRYYLYRLLGRKPGTAAEDIREGHMVYMGDDGRLYRAGGGRP